MKFLRLFILGPGVGESVVLQLPDGQWGVVDCFQSDLNQGLGTVDFLKKRKIRKLAFFCQTHPHEDHFLGSHSLLKQYSGKIANIWRHPGFSSRDVATRMILAAKVKARAKKDPEADRVEKEYAALLAGLSREKKLIPPERYRRIVGSYSLLSGKDYEIFSLGPQAGVLERMEERLAARKATRGFLIFSDDEGGIINNLSVVLQITFGKSDIFLLADAQGKNLHFHPKTRRCTLIKIAHHGSDNGLASNRITSGHNEYRVNHTVVTPFRRSRLPTATMLKKYQDSCVKLRLTSHDPIQPAHTAMLGFTSTQKIANMKGWLGIEITANGRIRDCAP